MLYISIKIIISLVIIQCKSRSKKEGTLFRVPSHVAYFIVFLIAFSGVSVHGLHALAAAQGDGLARLQVEDLVADGADVVPFLLRLGNRQEALFLPCYHGKLLSGKKGAAEAAPYHAYLK